MTTEECLNEIIAAYMRLAGELTENEIYGSVLRGARDRYHYAKFALACSGVIERYLEGQK